MKKINPKLLIITFIIILFALISATASKYVIEKRDTHIQESSAFYFESNMVNTVSGETSKDYEIKEWNGRDNQEIDFNIKNYYDNQNITENDIKYKLEAQITDNTDLVELQIVDNNQNDVTNQELSITGNQLNENDYKLIIKPKVSTMDDGQVVNVQLKITSTEPYEKEIISNIKLTVHAVPNYVVNLIEGEDGQYVKLNIKVNMPEKDFSVKYDNTKLTLDRANYILTDVYEVSQTTMNSFTIPKGKLEKGSVYELYFIRKNADTVELGTDIIIEESTIGYEAGMITFSTPIWESNKASMEVINHSTYSMQYQIIEAGEEPDLEGTWTTVNPKKVTITNLVYNEQVVVRLYDGTTYTGIAIRILSDTEKPTINIEATEVTTKSITIKATSVDNESGFDENEPYKYYIAESIDGFTTNEASNLTGDYTFKDLDANKTYYIKVTRKDIAENVGGENNTEIITVKTEIVPSAEENINRVISWIPTNTPETAQATLNLSTKTNFIIQYKLNDGDWTNYENELTLTNGDSVSIVLTDEKNQGLEYTFKVEDKTGPEITLNKESTTTHSITVKAQAIDAIAGMPNDVKYNYYIEKDGTYVQEGVEQENTTFTFENLTSETAYNIKVSTKDLIGNVGEKTITIATNKFDLVKGNIVFSLPVWKNKSASVVLTNNTENQMQYQIIPKGNSIDINGTWSITEEKQITIEDLKDGDMVISRLYDGTNVTDYASITIDDNTGPTVEIEGNPTEWITQDVTITINAEDTESGIEEDGAYSFDGGTTWQTENIKTYTENQTGIVVKVRDEAGNINTQSINITKIDKTGPQFDLNISSSSSSVTVNISNLSDSGVGLEDVVTYKYYPLTEDDQIDESTNSSKTYTGLTQGQTYTVKVEIQDKLGNISEKTATVETGSISTDFSISEPIWENKKASVTITNSSEYKLQYQILTNNTEKLTETGWITVDNQTQSIVTCSDLLHEYVIYAKLTDDTNYSATISQEIKDITMPEVTVVGNPTSWIKEDVILTINAQDTESGLEEEGAYSFDGGATWQTENTKTYTENQTGIVVKVRDEAGNVYTESINITQIDKTNPTVTIEEQEKTTKQITINVKSTDPGSGMPENTLYTYSIREDGTETYTQIATDVSQTTYTFENLKSNTKHYIKVETLDSVGNKGEAIKEITTDNLLYVNGDIETSNLIWRNSIAQITVNNKSENYDMEYQVKQTIDEKIEVDGEWIEVNEKTVEIGNFKEGNVVYIRLTDGYNGSAEYATANITNSSKKEYTQTELAQNTTRGSHEILGISVANNEIKVQINQEIEGASLYNYYYKTISEDNYKLAKTNTYGDDTAIITDVEEEVVYKIKVLITNSDGTIIRSTNTATAITLGQAETNTVYEKNRTYIDNSTTLTARVSGEAGNGDTPETEEITAGYTITIPEDFKVSNTSGENKQSEGVVLVDANDNEYIWIPVDDAIYDGVTTIPTDTIIAQTNTYRPMAIEQTLEGYLEEIVYTFNGTLSFRNTSNTGIGNGSYKEPSLITNSSLDGYTWKVREPKGNNYDAIATNYQGIGFNTISEFGEYMANSYNNMINSVDSFGGFLMGRYETTQSTVNGNIIIGSKANGTILSNLNWYKMYLYQDSQKYDANPYNTSDSVVSSMAWGTQYDAMFNYILKGADASKITSQIGTQKNTLSNSAQDSTDIINNFYDLGSNAHELTQEATSYTSRIYRGGSYDSTKIQNTPMTKTEIYPSDLGPVFGSRLGLYIKGTNDQTPPETSIISTSATTNTITVEAQATDKESGINRYTYYYIKEENDTEWTKAEETVERTYTYTGLKQNTTYNIKVVATDGSGNIGEDTAEVTTLELGNVASTAITLGSKYGKNGEGVVALKLDETYETTGYYIQYQVVNEGETLNESGTWTTGNEITGLSNNQTIYARIYDGVNLSSDYYVQLVKGLDGFAYYTDSNGNSSETSTVAYADDSGSIAYIPAGFKVATGDSSSQINTGLVIQDENGNEYIWVPVETAIETEKTTTSTEKALARVQTGNTKYYEGILYSFSGTTSTKQRIATAMGQNVQREPSLVTGSSDYTWNVADGSAKGASYDTLETYYKNMHLGTSVTTFNTYTEWGQYMNEQYSNMVKSVDQYGGFYIGRYETSVNTTGVNATVQSQANKNPIYNQSWYQCYYYQDSNINTKNPYYESTSVVSSMIWGSQWDAVLNWMLKDDSTKDFVTSVTGNRTGSRANTGQTSTDFAKNIFDMSANVVEWTQEARSTTYRNFRGGSFLLETDKFGTYTASGRYTTWQPPADVHIYTNPDSTGGDSSRTDANGTRLALYIKNNEDTTLPVITGENTVIETGTNNIKITLDVNDEESGIAKYKYILSNSSTFAEENIEKTIETYGYYNEFTDLYQGQTYYIKVEVTNVSGQISTYISEAIQTEKLELTEIPVNLEKVYGKSLENDGIGGYAYLTLSDKYEEEGYHIQYQILQGIETPTTEWKTATQLTSLEGGIISGLTTGDIIYTRITDGNNTSSEGVYKTIIVEELEKYDYYENSEGKTTQTTTLLYTDKDGNQAYIPAGFKIGTTSLVNSISKGLVIEDEKENQYVWIPVKDAIYDGTSTIPTSTSVAQTNSYRPMARYQRGYNSESTNQYFEGILYNYSGTTSYSRSTTYLLETTGYRGPSLVTNSNQNLTWVYNAGSSYDGKSTPYTPLEQIKIGNEQQITSPTTFGQYMNNKYSEMVLSVEQYGGFYVGRYETSRWTSDTVASNTQNTGTIIKSVPNATPMASTNWYTMYTYSDGNYENNPYNESTSINSAMIWGSQWDAMLNYILTGSDKSKVTAITGNHSGSRTVTGKYPSDIMNNIFDLSSNVREWTQEAYSSTSRTYRGGDFSATGLIPAGYRYSYHPTITYYSLGSRLTLYLK